MKHILDFNEGAMKGLFLLACLLGFSCSEKVEKKEETMPVEKVLKINDAQDKKFRYTELFDSVRIIPLDTIGDFLLQDVENIKFGQERIFVQDRGHRIFIFDKNGKGLAKIDKKGQGPQEYLSIIGFDVSDSDGMICTYVYPLRLMYWDFNGRFVKEVKVDVNGSDMTLLGNDKVAVFADNLRTTQENRMPQLEVFDLTDATSEGYFPGYSFYAGHLVPRYQQSPIFRESSSGERLMVHPLSNDIISLSESGVKVKYRLDFESDNPNPEQKDGYEGGVWLHDYIAKEFPVYGFNGYWENDKWFYLKMFKNQRSADLLYDKQKGVLYNCGVINDDMTGTMFLPIKAEDDYLVGYLNAGTIIDIEDFLQSQGRGKKGSNPVYDELLDVAQRFENPIICLFYFKSNKK